MPSHKITTKGLVLSLILYSTMWAAPQGGDFFQIRQPDGSSVELDCLPVSIDQDKTGTAIFDCEPARWLSDTGEPRIPWQVITVLLPPQADLSTVSCRIDAENYEILEGVWDVQPAPPIATRDNDTGIIIWPEDKDIVDGLDIDIYETDAFWPGEKVRVISVGKLHGWRLAEIAISLVIYNPAGGQLCVLRDMAVTMDYTLRENHKGAGLINVSRQAHLRGHARVQQMAVNFEAAKPAYEQAAEVTDSVFTNETGAGEIGSLVPNMSADGYVIITTSTIQSASSNLGAFVAHKQSRGYTVTVITESEFGGGQGDAAANNLRAWLQANYLNSDYGTNGILYVLLIGNPHPDNGYVPMKMCISDHPTDYFYAELTGDWDSDGDGIYGESEDEVEKYFEVYVGRIPYYGTISDTDHILQKTIDYENASEVNWRRNALLPMVPLDSSTPSYQLGEQIKTNLLEPEAISSDRIYDETYGVIAPPEYLRSEHYPATVWSQVIYGLNVWMTHGWSRGASGVIGSGDAPNLNDAYPTTTWQGSCDTGHPEDDNNLAYAILKNGGIATVGASRNAWYYVGQSNFTNTSSVGGLGYQYAKRIVQRQSCGQTLYNSKEAMSLWIKNYYVMNLYGDPSVVVMPEMPLFTVSPTDEFYTTKVKGASFTMSARSYTLKNNGGTTINWTATNTSDWLIVPASGVIPGGGSDAVDITLTAAADYLPLGTHTATVTFTDTTNGIVYEREIRAVIQPRILAGYWKLDESSGTSASDSSGNGHDGTLTHEQSFDNDSVSGQFDNALNFDGVDDYVKLPSLDFHSDRATITAWIKRNGDQKDYAGIVFRTTGDDTGLNFNTNNGLRYHWNNASSTYNWDSGLTVPDNQWIFVALVVEPTQATIYMYDGILHWATNTMTHDLCSFALESAIGRDRSGREFTGSIDEVRIYNYALDETAIAALVQGGRSENIMPFDDAENVSFPILSWVGGATAVQYDIYVGINYDAVANATTWSPEYQGRQTPEKYQLPILYINTDYYWRIDCVDAFSSVTAGAVCHFATGTGTGSVIRQVWLDIKGSSVTDLTGDPDYPDNPDITDELSTFESPTDWASDYGTRIYGYLIPWITGSYTFWIASDDYGELSLSSDHDPAHAVKIANVPGWTDSRQWDKFSQQQSNPVALVAGRVYYMQALQKEGGGDDNLAVAWQGPGIDRQVIEGAYLSAGLLASPPSSLISHWKLDATSGAVAEDAVGDNDGVLMGDPTWHPTGGKFEGALDFDGTDDYVSLPIILNPTNNSFSAFAWARLEEKAGVFQIILQQEGDNGRSWLYRDATDEKLKSYLGGQVTASSTAVFTDTGEWHHVGLTYNGVTLKLYIDGEEEASNDVTAESANGVMRLGAFISNSYPTHKYWSGLIDDMRIYNVALNADQVKSLMNFRIGWWKLNETTGLLATDDAGSNRGRLFNFTGNDSQWNAGKLENALQFDGLDDFVDLGNSSSLKPDLPISMAAWINLDDVGSDIQIVFNLDKKNYDDTHRIYGFQLTVWNTGNLFVSFGDGQPNYNSRYKWGSTVLQPNLWYHVAAVIRSADDMSLYLNGRDDGGEIVGTGGDMVYSDGTSQLGSRNGDTLFLHGDMDDVRMYDRGLSPEEIAALARPLLDLNSNGRIGLVDLYLLSGDWLETSCDPLPRGDFDVDCDVDLTDYARLAAQWMQEIN